MEVLVEEKPKRKCADRAKAFRNGWNFFLWQCFGFEDGQCCGGVI